MIANYEVDGQISIFDMPQFLSSPKKESSLKRSILSVGDMIGKRILGECRIARITKVVGSEESCFYRTDDGGCFSYEDGLNDIESLKKEAETERTHYKTIVPSHLKDRITVQYAPRKCDGRVLWAQLGVYENMLFWKENTTFQFLEPYASEKELRKAYEKHKEEILSGNYEEIEEKPMKRLYWSSNSFFADAEYVSYHM